MDVQNLDGVRFHTIDDDVGHSRMHELARALNSPAVAYEGHRLEPPDSVVEVSDGRRGKFRPMLRKVGVDVFEVVGGGRRPADTPHERSIRPIRASISA